MSTNTSIENGCFLLILAFLLIAVVAGILSTSSGLARKEADECSNLGGQIIKSQYGTYCIDASVIINLDSPKTPTP